MTRDELNKALMEKHEEVMKVLAEVRDLRAQVEEANERERIEKLSKATRYHEEPAW